MPDSRQNAPAIYEQVTKYHVSMLPESCGIDAWTWAVEVEYRGDGRWAVTHMSQCLAADGTWGYERQPSSRTDEWLAARRFTLDEALRLAREQAPLMVINGLTPADVLARHEERARA